MRIQFVGLVITLVLSACSLVLAENNNDNVITLKFKGDISGMKVEALWKPNELRNGYVLGPAILEFTNMKHGTSSTVVENKLGILESRLGGLIKWHKGKNGEKVIQSIAKKEITFDYKKPNLKGKQITFEGALNEPFFFYDVNFDGKDDLLVAEMFTGQRSRTAFRAYETDGDQDVFVLKDEYLQITNKEPYILLDEASNINRTDKTIQIDNSNGAADSYKDTYMITADGFIKTSTEYPDPPENASKILMERPLKLCGKPKKSLDGKTEFLMTPAWETECALYKYSADEKIYRFISPASGFYLITEGKLAGNIIVETHEYFASGGSGSYDWLWIMTPYGKKLEPSGSADSVDWEAMEFFYGIKRDSAEGGDRLKE